MHCADARIARLVFDGEVQPNSHGSGDGRQGDLISLLGVSVRLDCNAHFIAWGHFIAWVSVRLDCNAHFIAWGHFIAWVSVRLDPSLRAVSEGCNVCGGEGGWMQKPFPVCLWHQRQ